MAMTGGTLRHNATVNRIAAALERALAGIPCHVFRENVKLVTERSSRYPTCSSHALRSTWTAIPWTTPICWWGALEFH
ncbi:MAG TPA: hypothetical protein VFY39_01555 [Gammaproteobacteria bacterium]|nr:hypothetical protein [Gammaproteobacteria bacterium]